MVPLDKVVLSSGSSMMWIKINHGNPVARKVNQNAPF